MKTGVFKLTSLTFSLVFCLGLASCNKEEFYEKEFLENPNQIPPTRGTVDNGGQGGADSGAGSTQGGVDSGVNGGTTGSTTGSSTNGSSTGGTTGGVDGSTTSGSTDGSVTSGSSTSGSTNGSSTVGSTDGSTTSGSTTGSSTGGVTGSTTSGSTTSGSTTAGSTTGSTTAGSTTGSTTSGSTTGSTTSGYVDCNNGHGNEANHVDGSNPTVGTESKCKMEKFKQSASKTKMLDIVWVIDNSGSMADEQASLGTNFNAFIDSFIKKNVDFKMAITTTDTSKESRKGKIVGESDKKLTSAKAKANEAQFKKDFKDLVKVGTGGSGYEKGLEASEGFIEKHASSFLRKDAYLAVVILSDEEDQSPKSVKQYTDYMKSVKNEAGLVKVYSIVDVGLTNANAPAGTTAGYYRYKEASEQSAGLVADIRDSFYRTLEDMGEQIIKLLDSFALANDPVPGTLKVYVNGVEVKSYAFDAATRSIKFDSNNLPPVGAEIKVTYVKQ